MAEGRRVGAVRYGEHREAAGRVVEGMAPGGDAQAFGQEAGDVQERRGMLGDDLLEGGAPEAQQMRVAQGRGRRRARLVGEERHLAERLRRRQAGEAPGLPVPGIAGGDAHRAGDEDVERVALLPLLEHRHAASDRDGGEPPPDGRGDGGVEPRQEGDRRRAHPTARLRFCAARA